MEKPELFLQVKNFLDEYEVLTSSKFTANFLLNKIAEENNKASEKFAKTGKVEDIKENMVNLIFLMTSMSCLMDINPLEEINKRIGEFKKGYHPILDEFLAEKNK